MLTRKEIGKLAKLAETQKAYPFTMKVDEFMIIVSKERNTYLLDVKDKDGRTLLSMKDKEKVNSVLEIKEHYTSQSECDLVEAALRGVLV